ncbi:MAG TPA: serine hydrolase domain-containing protein [Longimicrobium sp.]|nr:serine hydrolase domain-containing protein [Longimicrobium sp.]
MYRLPILACAALCIGTSPATAQQPVNDSTRLALNRVFAAWSAADGPGCAVGVSRAGNLIFQNGYGLANLETETPITPSSVFHVASVSKQFTAAAVMLLAREGKLSLDDDVRRHLPELPDYGHRITLRHLLTHTSGLRDQWDLLAMARGRFEENRITEDDVLEIVARQKALNFVPGTEYLYSNTGYTLLAVVVRRVSGKSLREFADERIFQPLGMSDTHFHDDYTMVVKGRAAGYARRPAGGWRVSLPNYDTYGATSLFTTVGDLLKWDANFATSRVGDEGMWREMMASGVLAGGDTTGYGFGIATEEYRGTRLVGHGGADAGYRTYLGRFPEHALSVVVLCNAAQANPSALTRSVADVLLGDRLAPAPEPPAARVTLASEELSALEGVYVHPVTGAPFFITRRGDTLVAGRIAGPALVPMGERRFRVGAQPVELAFTPEGGLVQTVLAWPRPTPVTLRRQELARPSRAELEAYAGTWYSEELGATYTVAATDSTLVLRTRWGAERTVRPAYGDTFFGDYLLAFTRGRGGRVDGMRMSTGRVRGVRFERVRR